MGYLLIYLSLSPNDILVGFAIFTQFAQYITRVTKTHLHTQPHGVLFTSDLALEKQVTSVSAMCFFQLRQLRRVRRSLDGDIAVTRVHAFVTSRIDYGNALLTNAPKIWTEKLQRVLNAAARVITGTRKFDSGLSHILHHDSTGWMFPNVSSSNCA